MNTTVTNTLAKFISTRLKPYGYKTLRGYSWMYVISIETGKSVAALGNELDVVDGVYKGEWLIDKGSEKLRALFEQCLDDYSRTVL